MKEELSPHLFSTEARWFLGIFGMLLALAGIALTIDPPNVREFAPQCAKASCVAEVEEPSDVTPPALIGAGAVLVLVAVNGRRLSGLKIAGAEATMAEEKVKDEQAKAAVMADLATTGGASPSDASGTDETSPGEGDARVLSIAGRDLVRVAPEQVPIRVLTDLTKHGAPIKSSADIAWGARQGGQGNHPWFVQTRGGRVFKVSYGGQGKEDATVSEVLPAT